jgi:hypothetical protein
LFNDTEGAKPEGSDKSEGSTAEALSSVAEAKSGSCPLNSSFLRLHMLQGHPLQLQEKILDEKIYQLPRLKEQEKTEELLRMML